MYSFDPTEEQQMLIDAIQRYATNDLRPEVAALVAGMLDVVGIEARFVDSSGPGNLEKSIDGNTRLLFTETIGNPKMDVPDIGELSQIAHRHSVPLVVDNTVYVASLDKTVYALDAATHVERWRFAGDAMIRAAPAHADGLRRRARDWASCSA